MTASEMNQMSYETKTAASGKINGYRYTIATGAQTSWHRTRKAARTEAEEMVNAALSAR